MRRATRVTVGVALAAVLTLGAGGAAGAAPEAKSACLGRLSAAFAPQRMRDDVSLLHNAVYKGMGETPGQGYRDVVHARGALAY